MNAIALGFVMVGVLLVAFIVGVVIYRAGRKKAKTWNVRVYGVSTAERIIRDDKGDKIAIKRKGDKTAQPLKLQNLDLLGIDVLKKINTKKGVIFELQKLGKTVPAPNIEDEVKLDKMSEINVIYDGNSSTILKPGYNRQSGELIYQPVPYDTVTMMINDMQTKKDRKKAKTTMLQAILPYVAIVMGFLAMIAIAYISIEGQVKISQELSSGMKEMQEKQLEANNEFKQIMVQMTGIELPDKNMTDSGLGLQNEKINKEGVPKLE